jgi:Transposase DDE domain
MQMTVALRGRTRLAALLQHLEQEAGQRAQGQRCDQRNRRTWRQLILGMLVARSTRLVALGRVVAPQRRVSSVKAAAMALTYFLQRARVPVPALSTGLLEAAVRQVDPEHLVTYRGKVLLVLDPTEYEKRSRERGKCGHQMEHIGRVRRSKRRSSTKQRTKQSKGPVLQDGGGPAPQEERRTATAPGYVDVWAGLVLRGKQFLPLARQLFSSRHPQCTSQNAVEEAVLAQALALLHRLALPAIVLGDKGLGRKELIIRLANQDQDAVLRVDTDITVYPLDAPDGLLLAAALARQPWRGAVDWDRGAEGVLRCRLRTLRATIRFSRTGRKDDVQEGTVTFVQAVPLEGPTEPLVLATTLPVDTVVQVRAIVRLYAQRWAIETGFETMHAWGQEAFMVRRWRAIECLLWVLAVAYALVVLALYQRTLRAVRRQAMAVLKALSVVGDHLTVGKLAEAIGLDYQQHRKAWLAAWLQ